MKKHKLWGAFFCAFIIYLSLFAFSVGASAEGTDDALEEALSDNVVVGSRIYELFFGEKKNETKSLYVGGEVFGIKIKGAEVTVAEAKGIPALKCGDVVISINGKKISSAKEARDIISSSGGESVTIAARRGEEIVRLEVRPRLRDGEYQLGLTLRDGAVGIGTVTFVDPLTGRFGGLGHGICDSDTGEVVEMESGEVVGVILGSVHKGECGKPGELSGILTEKKLGTIESNNECGVFGVLSSFEGCEDRIFEIGKKSEVHEGEATIFSTIKNGKRAEYKIEIYDVDKSSDGSKSFRIRVCDPALFALTGGIVRGMSGSPIIQDGKLVGAVTHVMVADPTEGYGIFIENMLSAAQSQQAQPKAA